MKKAPLARKVPLVSTTALTRNSRIKPVSKKRAAENRERRKVVAELFADNQTCQMRLPGCTGWATDPHEPLTRARGGSITDPAGIVLGCRNCHTRVHTDTSPGQQDMHDLGLLVHSWDIKRGEPSCT